MAGAAKPGRSAIGRDRLAAALTPDVYKRQALHSPTLGEGLAKLARYKRLVCPEKITIDIVRREARLRFEWLLAESNPPPVLTDAMFAGIVSLAQRGAGEAVRPLRLELTRRRAHEAMLCLLYTSRCV